MHFLMPLVRDKKAFKYFSKDESSKAWRLLMVIEILYL